MNEINACNALQSATKIKNHLHRKGFDIPQSALKEALSSCLGYNNSNRMLQDARTSFDHFRSSNELQKSALILSIEKAAQESYFKECYKVCCADIFFEYPIPESIRLIKKALEAYVSNAQVNGEIFDAIHHYHSHITLPDSYSIGAELKTLNSKLYSEEIPDALYSEGQRKVLLLFVSGIASKHKLFRKGKMQSTTGEKYTNSLEHTSNLFRGFHKSKDFSKLAELLIYFIEYEIRLNESIVSIPNYKESRGIRHMIHPFEPKKPLIDKLIMHKNIILELTEKHR